MRLPRVRFTVRRTMIVVSVATTLALIGAALVERGRKRGRRTETGTRTETGRKRGRGTETGTQLD
jgi:hypothetical protein